MLMPGARGIGSKDLTLRHRRDGPLKDVPEMTGR